MDSFNIVNREGRIVNILWTDLAKELQHYKITNVVKIMAQCYVDVYYGSNNTHGAPYTIINRYKLLDNISCDILYEQLNELKLTSN